MEPGDARDTERDALWDAYAAEAECPDTLDLVLESDAMLAVFAGERYRRIAELHREAHRGGAVFRGSTREITERSLRLELAMALRLSENAVEQLLADAEALTDRYPGMLDLLLHAQTTERHAKTFIELVDTVEPELREQVVPRALELAALLPAAAFRRQLRTLVERVRSDTLAARHERAVADRRVVLEPAHDGMAWLHLFVPAVEARAIFDRTTAVGKVLHEASVETRTIGQLRADVVCDLLIDGEVPAHPKKARGIRATVAVTVPALTLLDGSPGASAEVEGVGPIPTQRARELCAGVKGWMRVLTHPETGVILSIGRKKYRPPSDMDRFVRFRAGRCTGPGCGRSSADCDLDHTIAWAEGGDTAVGNLNPLCRGHHTVKGDGGWHVTQLDGGVMRWVSPSGRVHLVEPEHRMPTFRPQPDTTPAPF